MKKETQSFYELGVGRAIERIRGGLEDALDLGALAKQAALSPLHFHRVFRGLTGETPLEMHRRLRLERAAHAVATSDAAVTTIAFDAGYETHEAFTRAFRQCFALSPTGFRDAARNARERCKPPLRWELAARTGLHWTPQGAPLSPCELWRGPETMNVEIKNMPEMRLATIRHVGPYSGISEAFARLGGIAGPAGLFQTPSAAMVALYHDDPDGTPPEKLRSDAALAVPEGRPLPPGLEEQRIAKGRFAMTIHRGPYSNLGDSWSRLMGEWLPASGHRVREGALSFELYRNTPMDTKPEDLTTELYVPID